MFYQRIRNLVSLAKYKYRTNKNKVISTICIICICSFIIAIVPKNLRIYFIDVGQGDSTLIITPLNKKILIDGGGTEFGDYNVGEKTLMPYLLARRIRKIDYIIISHFDTDHCQGLLYIMQEMKVKNVIIGKQYEENENYRKFVNIIKEKNIKVKVVEAGSRISIERNLYFDVLWPDSDNIITQNAINNNSLVCKLVYKKFSILFTGDIEEIAEKAIIAKYKNQLKSTVLKVAHHGSKTSSTMEFINAVNPKYALIGVGKDNKFGHPADITIQDLEAKNIQIYRTDEMGEVTINIKNLTKREKNVIIKRSCSKKGD